MAKYVDVSVSNELLERLKQEQHAAIGMARYGRFKAWLHYANLKSWQGQGWHFNYLNYNGESLHCTCGLAISMNAKTELAGLENLRLDPVHRARGHRNLPSLRGVCVAFIFDYEWRPEKGCYFYRALCQVCLSYSELLPAKGADWFVDLHNQQCMSE